MVIVEKAISLDALKQMSEKMFGGLVKAVVDIKKEILVVDAHMHSDQEELLLEQESKQEDLWGINIFPDKYGQEDFIVFDSMINLRPSWGNKSRGVDNPEIQKRIKQIVKNLVTS